MTRSNQSFVLLFVAAISRSGARFPVPWRGIIKAVASSIRQTDLVGWFDEGTVIGVILTDIPRLDALLAHALESRVRQRVRTALKMSETSAWGIRVQIHSEPPSCGDHGSSFGSLLVRVPQSARVSRYDAVKRCVDVLGSLGMLVALAPVFLLVALAVKLDSRGPILFRQVRVGRMMKPFMMLKFRTMSANADPGVHQAYVTQLIQGAGQQRRSNELFKITNDPRVTRVGRLLRRTSLDELPQFWNVLRGDMSLVGPRPPLPYEVDRYQPWHRLRVIEAKPGLTGLWQVVGRSRTTFDEMVRLDLEYARTRSLGADLRILLATPRAMISGKGAC